jgi:Tol biopolymer transport system component
MDPDGSKLTNLTGAVGFAGCPAWAPDGTLIAFETDLGDHPSKQGIYVMNALDGSGLRRITTLPAGASFDGAARFSPDGEHLVFTRSMDDGSSALFVVGLDGFGLRQVTSSGVHPGDATCSPDGAQLVFEADSPGRIDGGVWTIGADGSELKDLIPDPSVPGTVDGFADPVCSAEGILLLHGLFAADGTRTAGLATTRPDGTDLRYVAAGKGDDHQPDRNLHAGC